MLSSTPAWRGLTGEARGAARDPHRAAPPKAPKRLGASVKGVEDGLRHWQPLGRAGRWRPQCVAPGAAAPRGGVAAAAAERAHRHANKAPGRARRRQEQAPVRGGEAAVERQQAPDGEESCGARAATHAPCRAPLRGLRPPAARRRQDHEHGRGGLNPPVERERQGASWAANRSAASPAEQRVEQRVDSISIYSVATANKPGPCRKLKGGRTQNELQRSNKPSSSSWQEILASERLAFMRSGSRLGDPGDTRDSLATPPLARQRLMNGPEKLYWSLHSETQPTESAAGPPPSDTAPRGAVYRPTAAVRAATRPARPRRRDSEIAADVAVCKMVEAAARGGGIGSGGAVAASSR